MNTFKLPSLNSVAGSAWERERVTIYGERARWGDEHEIARRDTTLIKRISVKETRNRKTEESHT